MAWDHLDRGYALAWQAERDTTHTCGQPTSESLAAANQRAYAAEVVRCHACATKDRVYKAFMAKENSDDSGLQVRLTRGPHGPM